MTLPMLVYCIKTLAMPIINRFKQNVKVNVYADLFEMSKLLYRLPNFILKLSSPNCTKFFFNSTNENIGKDKRLTMFIKYPKLNLNSNFPSLS